jgi:sugar phosphate isomerase/epimerase
MAIRVGIMSSILGTNDLEESFQLAKSIGVAGLEVAYRNADDYKLLAAPGHAKDLQLLSQKYGLAIPSLALIFLCDEPSFAGSPEIVAKTKRAVECAIAVAAEAKIPMLLLPFFRRNSIEMEKDLLSAIKVLGELVEVAESAGIVLAIESTLNFDQTKFLLSSLGGSDFAKVYYDVGNMVGKRLDASVGIRQFGSAGIAQFHFKDIKLAGGEKGDSNILMGQGSVDFNAVAQAIQAVEYDGWIILETPPLDDVIASGKQGLAFIQKLMK